jgi:hypothetical protein
MDVSGPIHNLMLNACSSPFSLLDRNLGIVELTWVWLSPFQETKPYKDCPALAGNYMRVIQSTASNFID